MRLLPDKVPYDELPQPAEPHRFAIGIAESDLLPVVLDFAADPHFLLFGDAECGKSTFLRSLATSIATRFTPAQARIILVDYRRSLLGTVDTEHLIGYGTAGPSAAKVVADAAAAMRARLPGPDVTPAAAAQPQLVDRPGAVRAGRRLRPGRHRATTRCCRCWSSCRRAGTSACT